MCASLPMYYADQNEVHVDILEWGFCPPFVHVDRGEGEGYVNFHACPLEGGRGSKLVKFWST